ncbi:HAMP domain-containing sensor histidine kinase [Sphingomonas sp. NFR15]|uniref:sensor histidine kinase n=1 Tax=Sphingomonas sp. NFR15 TaxID=1566282 RepID=UPI00088FCD8C|nr:HAMP domain-containing sensor histidine kinase [Sphingomonas sp. NFR15]SDA36545.1 Signal transduction histidine kinase [Sphingomonas sp. NFR15]
MIGWAKALAKRHWPKLRIRTILFGTLLFVAALPGVAALFLRVYENTIVQQTEAELIAQGAVLGAAYKAAWAAGLADPAPRRLAPEPPRIDLRTMPILPPQRAPRGRFAGDPRAARAARAILPIASDAAAVTLTATRLLDARGVVVLGRGDVGRRYAALPEVRAALAGRAATVLRARGQARWLAVLSRAYAIRVHHARPVLFGGRVIGVVLSSRSPRGLFVGIRQDAAAILTGIALILATLLVLVGLLSRGIARPIDQLARASEGVALGHVEMPDTPVTAAIEIAQLYDAFRGMAARIERRSRYLRDFAAAVSHEFKTPIAGIRGALELLDEHGGTMAPDERARFLANAAADAERLQRLVQRLLDLARADMVTIDAGASADVVAAARRVADSCRADGFAVTLAGVGAAAARITPEVIETVLETLLENSRQAGARAVTIGIIAGDTVRITVTDDGPGIAPADHERIFEPFFTGRREAGGTGLGLAIARSLLAASGGTIAAVAVERGACFEAVLMR